MKNILVTGGAGYVGAVLVPLLLDQGYRVKVIDLFIYGDVLPYHPHLTQVRGDIRDTHLLEREIPGSDAMIHLACISNDPSYELNPALSKTINYDAFIPLVAIAKKHRVKRFIFASSSSVYGVKETLHVTEDLPLDPLTDYSKFKALCEAHVLQEQTKDFTVLILRPATVCGYSPRLRLDLTVNILTHHALTQGVIKVFGGGQRRPNIHIKDMADLYLNCLRYPDEKIAGKIFNAGYENHTVMDIACLVKTELGYDHVKVVVEPTKDNRSYHISSEKIKRELGFVPRYSIAQAVRDLKVAFENNLVPNSTTDRVYYNIKMMQHIKLT